MPAFKLSPEQILEPIQQQVTGSIFPKVISGPAATYLAMQYQLNHSQCWSHEKMREHQFRQITQLVQHAYKHVPLYREKFKHLGMHLNGKIDEYVFSHLPILKRAELQDNPENIKSQYIPPEHGKTGNASTSGSTGQPVKILTTDLSTLMWRAFTFREHFWFNRDFSKQLAAIRYAPHGTAEIKDNITSKEWGPATNISFNTGPSSFLNSNVDIKDQAQWLIAQKPEYLMSHPSNIQALAEYFIEHNLHVPNLVEIRSHGEPVTEKLRHLCQQAWKCKLADIYSTVEVGYIALQCPRHDHYHIQSEGIYVEILDDNNQPCKPGEIGRVVVTPLHNFGSPLIRYEVGDYAEAGEQCDCGRTLPVIKRVLGRVRNMVKLPNGGQVWPEFGYADFDNIKKIKQLQLIQHKIDAIEAKIVVSSPLTTEEENQLVKIWQRNFHYPFKINFTYVDLIPRGPSGKFEEFKSAI